MRPIAPPVLPVPTPPPVIGAGDEQALVVNLVECDGHGICAELFPEWVRLDDWGYPIIDGRDIRPRYCTPMPAAP